MKPSEEVRRGELEGLLVEEEDRNVDKLMADVLTGRIAVEKATGRVVPRAGLYRLSEQRRLLLLLLAPHAARKLGHADAQLELSPEQLASQGQVPIKNCREQLSRLKGQGVISRGSNGYLLPPWNVLLAAETLSTGGTRSA